MKIISGQWIVGMSDHFCLSPEIVVNGFKAIARSIDAGKSVIDDDSDSISDFEDCDSDEYGTTAYFTSEDEN